MARTSNIYIRVEPDIKQEAENILKELGIPMSNAVGMFLRQVILQNGIPFDMKLPSKKPISLEMLSREELNEELRLGLKDFENGDVYTADEVKEHLSRKYGI